MTNQVENQFDNQVEAIADELDTQALDVVVGGLICRKAGGDTQGIIAI